MAVTRLGHYGGSRAARVPMSPKTESVVEVAPPDDDTVDSAGTALTITAHLDRDAATIRPPRVTLLHALNDLRNVALTSPDRLPMDTYEAKSDRYGRGTQEGNFLRLYAYTLRAAEMFALSEVVVDFDLVPADTYLNPGTVTGTDKDGASMSVGTVGIFTAADSLRDADLVAGVGTVQDTHEGRFWAADTLGIGNYLRVLWNTDGRAGGVACPVEIEVEFELVGAEVIRAAVT